MEAAFIPAVNDELDTQNFEKFEEVSVSLRFLLGRATYLKPFTFPSFLILPFAPAGRHPESPSIKSWSMEEGNFRCMLLC